MPGGSSAPQEQTGQVRAREADATGAAQPPARVRTGRGFRIVSSLEITELTAPTTFGWEEHGARRGSKTLFQLEAVRGSTRITVLHWWTPHSFVASVRGRVLVKRRVERTLNATLRNLRNALN